MQKNILQDEKIRGIIYQTLVVGFFALGLFYLIDTTTDNLQKRNIATAASINICNILTDPIFIPIPIMGKFSSHWNI